MVVVVVGDSDKGVFVLVSWKVLRRVSFLTLDGDFWVFRDEGGAGNLVWVDLGLGSC